MRKSIRIMTTSYCKNTCKYCFVKYSKNYKPQKGIWENIKNSLDNIEYSSIELIGGEPFHDLDILKEIFEYTDKPITFFTSGTYNQKEVLDLVLQYKSKIQFTFFFSYDGMYSERNKFNHKDVKYWIEEFKKHFNVSIRWSVNQEDIKYLYEHFLEHVDLKIDTPIFFPMKYFDYTDNDIQIFLQQFEKILDYCIKNNINWKGLLSETKRMYFGTKDTFRCDNELTILPDGRFVNCYVAFSSFEFDENMITLKPEKDTKIYFQSEKICEKCLSVFASCNKCPGNLKQYQLKTNNYFYYSYCKLMSELGKMYIKKRSQIDCETLFIFTQGNDITNVVTNINNKIIISKPKEVLW